MVIPNKTVTVANVRVRTSVDGAVVTLDGKTSPDGYDYYEPGKSLIISVPTIQTVSGTRYRFVRWDSQLFPRNSQTVVPPAKIDIGAPTLTITASEDFVTYSALYVSEYELKVNTSTVPSGNGGTTTVTPVSADGYYRRNLAVRVRATANPNYRFTNWSGDLTGSTNPATVIMSGPRSITANFIRVDGVAVTVTTNPSGLPITVDSVAYASPHTFDWASGSSHAIGVTSPQAGDVGTRYQFSSWSDGGGRTHTIVASASLTTITANFKTQFRLVQAPSPPGSGTITANPASPDESSYYDAGTIIQFTARPAAGSAFAGWSGDLAGTANPESLTIAAPRTVTANFSRPLPVINSISRSSGLAGDVSPMTIIGNRLLAQCVNGILLKFQHL